MKSSGNLKQWEMVEETWNKRKNLQYERKRK